VQSKLSHLNDAKYLPNGPIIASPHRRVELRGPFPDRQRVGVKSMTCRDSRPIKVTLFSESEKTTDR